MPISELEALPAKSATAENRELPLNKSLSTGLKVSTPSLNKVTSIKLVRHRMFYARSATNAKGGVRFGMRHIRKHV